MDNVTLTIITKLITLLYTTFHAGIFQSNDQNLLHIPWHWLSMYNYWLLQQIVQVHGTGFRIQSIILSSLTLFSDTRQKGFCSCAARASHSLDVIFIQQQQHHQRLSCTVVGCCRLSFSSRGLVSNELLCHVMSTPAYEFSAVIWRHIFSAIPFPTFCSASVQTCN